MRLTSFWIYFQHGICLIGSRPLFDLFGPLFGRHGKKLAMVKRLAAAPSRRVTSIEDRNESLRRLCLFRNDLGRAKPKSRNGKHSHQHKTGSKNVRTTLKHPHSYSSQKGTPRDRSEGDISRRVRMNAGPANRFAFGT